DLLPAAVPDAELRAARPAHAADGDRRVDQPRHLRDGGDAVVHPRGPQLAQDLARLPRRRRVRRADGRAQRARHQSLRLMAELRARGLLFDMDGVLVSSAPSAERAWAVWAGEYGVDAQALLAVMHGRRSEDTIARFLPAEQIPAALARIEQIEIDD